MTLLVTVIVVALAFDFTNGFHDTANYVATWVGTRALSPRTAVAVSAVANLAGAFVTTAVAKTIGQGIIDSGLATEQTIIAALFGAIVWNLLTWRLGLPSSSSHALIGGLVGAALAAGSGVKWSGIAKKVVAPMILSPIAGFALGFVFMLALLWLFRRGNPHRLNRTFRYGQVAGAAAMSLGHGLQDAQKTMGVI